MDFFLTYLFIFISLLRRRVIVHFIDWAGCFCSRFTNDTQLSRLASNGSVYIPGQWPTYRCTCWSGGSVSAYHSKDCGSIHTRSYLFIPDFLSFSINVQANLNGSVIHLELIFIWLHIPQSWLFKKLFCIRKHRKIIWPNLLSSITLLFTNEFHLNLACVTQTSCSTLFVIWCISNYYSLWNYSFS